MKWIVCGGIIGGIASGLVWMLFGPPISYGNPIDAWFFGGHGGGGGGIFYLIYLVLLSVVVNISGLGSYDYDKNTKGCIAVSGCATVFVGPILMIILLAVPRELSAIINVIIGVVAGGISLKNRADFIAKRRWQRKRDEEQAKWYNSPEGRARQERYKEMQKSYQDIVISAMDKRRACPYLRCVRGDLYHGNNTSSSYELRCEYDGIDNFRSPYKYSTDWEHASEYCIGDADTGTPAKKCSNMWWIGYRETSIY